MPTASPLRVQLQTLGCRLNEAELEAWARQFRRRGCRIAGAGEPADLLVVNTCAVTAEAVRKSRKLLRRLKREHPGARLVVSGCAASLDAANLGDARIDLVVDNADKDRLVDIAAQALALPEPEASDAHMDAAEALFARGRQRAFVKVQDGCRYQCTFCVTTVARGAERSRPLHEIISEINAVAGNQSGIESGIGAGIGAQEIILTGVQLGGYGRDLAAAPAPDLTRLIAAVLRETDVPRIRLGSVEPWDLPDGFWCLFENPRLMPHLHLPLQSGADTVLRRMARRCRTDEFRGLVHAARAAIPDFNVSTDVIVGFPGETDAEWRQTMDFVASIGFGQLHIFPYSRRAGTRAAALPDQVPEPVKRARARQLHELDAVLRAEALGALVGRSLPILIEGENADALGRYAAGFTPSYLPVRLRHAPADAVGHIVAARLLAPSGDGTALEARIDTAAEAAPAVHARRSTAPESRSATQNS
ncbi:MAG: MiaB/RimO family radical SAM methylthiotransferase [Thiohalocapsa sp.]|jgi:threonylcarbamoyladenosine tRNA methylthiotransferase MtaB|uniref:MiaB/RimO family radical SAM methylthiotransferase n=1 Tax=Thiohalocapsa sp. TaxID=2497641 RepID=UPI0025D40B51|nr:MiaB/RimO family radical SAM methylthiotransferase [Thiohalocapsa sp.]MCG6941079.1 MiaB/RimO family radical SAM methylthiotransferase [Thiohalocapsa sp.]